MKYQLSALLLIITISVYADSKLSINEANLMYESLSEVVYEQNDNGKIILHIGNKAYRVKLNPNQFFEIIEDNTGNFSNSVPLGDFPLFGLCDNIQYTSTIDYISKIEWPIGTQLLCSFNREFVIAIYKHPNEAKIIVQGHSKDTNEPTLMKEISGTYFEGAYSESFHFYFYVSNDPCGFYNNKASYLGVINIAEGTICDITVGISLKAKPTMSQYGRSVYFVGIDECVYEFDLINRSVSMKWENKDNAEVIDFIISSNIYALKLRKNGKNYYKFFKYSFECEISTDHDISNLTFLKNLYGSSDTDKHGRPLDLGTLALITREINEATPPKLVLHRWFKDVPKLFSNLEKNKIPENCDNPKCFAEKVCPLLEIIDPLFENEILVKDYSKIIDYKQFSKPFSITVSNPKDGTQIPVNVWPPRNHGNGQPKPVIVYIHGGPNVYEDTHFDLMNLFKQVFASHDYWVIAPEARGSTGYGEIHEKALANDWNQGHLDDIIAVAEHFKSLDEVDSNTVFLMGSSFGGYTTLAMATHPQYSDYFTAYVPLAPLSNVGKAVYEGSELKNDITSKQKYIDVWKSRIGFDAVINFSQNKENKKISPYYHLKNIKRPVFQIHGTSDNITLPNQSIDVHARAYNLGLPVDTVMIENMGHNLGYMGFTELPLEFFRKVQEEGYQPKAQLKPHYISDAEKFLKNWKFNP